MKITIPGLCLGLLTFLGTASVNAQQPAGVEPSRGLLPVGPIARHVHQELVSKGWKSWVGPDLAFFLYTHPRYGLNCSITIYKFSGTDDPQGHFNAFLNGVGERLGKLTDSPLSDNMRLLEAAVMRDKALKVDVYGIYTPNNIQMFDYMRTRQASACRPNDAYEAIRSVGVQDQGGTPPSQVRASEPSLSDKQVAYCVTVQTQCKVHCASIQSSCLIGSAGTSYGTTLYGRPTCVTQYSQCVASCKSC